MTPKVSVVMPVYNGERYIAEAVTSVLTSDFADFELLIVDDGSTDASLAAATAAAGGDPRVRVLRLPHGGVGAARGAALGAARGELIANADADDAMFPDRLGRQVAFLDAHPECVAVGARSLVVTADGAPQWVAGRAFTHAAIDAALMRGDGGAIGNDAAMFRRDAALSLGGYSGDHQRSGEDHDLWLRMAEIGRLAVLPDVLNRYRVHGANSSLGDGSKERRLPVTLGNLERAFARRGIVDRVPAKVPSPPLRAYERWCNAALVAHFSMDRGAAVLRVLGALLFNPFAATTWSALRTILRGPPPWRRAGHDGAPLHLPLPK